MPNWRRDGKAVGLQGLGVELGNDLRLREVGRTDGDRFQVSRYLPAAERVGAAAPGNITVISANTATRTARLHRTCARHSP